MPTPPVRALASFLSALYHPHGSAALQDLVHPEMQRNIERHSDGERMVEYLRGELSAFDPSTYGVFDRPQLIGPDLEEYLLVEPPAAGASGMVGEDTMVLEGYRVTMRYDPGATPGNDSGWFVAGLHGMVLD